MIKRILLYGKKINDMQLAYIDILIEKLRAEKIDIFFYSEFYEHIKGKKSISGEHPVLTTTEDLIDNRIDLLISIGGDGTILNSAILIQNTGIPILGINLGRLGFLAIVEKNWIIQAVDKLIAHEFTLEQRSLLELNAQPELFIGQNIALNDFTVHKSTSPSVIVVHTYLNNKFLSSYWVDGLIISTPTGSTGYSLSCGGPIVFPGSGTFIITPVAPHNLTMRPIVVPDSSEIKLEIETRSDSILCSLDSRYESINSDYRLMIKKCDFRISLVVFEGLSFSDNIQNKLNWGTDKRN
ncbi:MAG: NAD kinase [Deltaproteobacteria bacterium]